MTSRWPLVGRWHQASAVVMWTTLISTEVICAVLLIGIWQGDKFPLALWVSWVQLGNIVGFFPRCTKVGGRSYKAAGWFRPISLHVVVAQRAVRALWTSFLLYSALRTLSLGCIILCISWGLVLSWYSFLKINNSLISCMSYSLNSWWHGGHVVTRKYRTKWECVVEFISISVNA